MMKIFETKMRHKTENANSLIFYLAMVGTAFMVMVLFSAPTASARTYTTDADFDEGELVGVEHETVPDQLQLSKKAVTLPFIWVPNNNGTVSKVHTETGNEIGRYRVVPPGLPENGSPSRTTVDLQGNCWVGNRRAGTVVKIGLYEAGNWIDRNGDGICQTSRDTNVDGDITGDELLPWGQDECVLYEVVLIPGREGTYVPGTFVGGGPTPTPTPTPIGEGWFHQDVGTPLPGSVAYAAGTWTITADGHDIWDTSDDFHFVYKPVSGDCEIIARVVSITPENLQGWEKAGVMIRETLDADSKHAMMVMTGGSGGGAAFQWRASTSGNSSWMEIYPNVSPAHWVKLVRKDNTFTGYISTDGDSGLWVYQGEINIKMSPKFYIGLCHTSHRSDSMSTAVFDNVNVTVVAPDYPYAWNPIPSDGAKYMPIDVTISWSPGDFAVSHDVYFGTSSTPAFIGNQLGVCPSNSFKQHFFLSS
jgi:hypothetical protein